jgi:hypothetical protein
VAHPIAQGYQAKDKSPDQQALLAALGVAISLPSIHELIIWI